MNAMYGLGGVNGYSQKPHEIVITAYFYTWEQPRLREGELLPM